MKKGTKMGLLGLAAGVGTLGSAAAVNNGLYALYNQVVTPAPRDPAKEKDEPAAQHEGRLWARAGEGFQSATIQSVDGYALWAAVVPAAKETHRWVICMHGFNETHEAMGVYGKRFHEQGWNVLMPDQRCYGSSEGNYVSWGFQERLDLVSWISYVTRRDADAQILLLGVSMGAATVLMATGGALPRNVKAAVSDCAYSSIESEIRHVISTFHIKGSRIPAVMHGPAFSMLRKTILRKTDFDLRTVSPIDAVRNSQTPTLFIHGVEDSFVPAQMMSKLYQAAKCPKSFLWIPGAVHTTAVGTDPELYWATVDTFIGGYFE